MKLAIMQPYLFPYIGYFQLMKAVDLFVVYDDVQFIKRGWINRNRILNQGKEYMFTIPLIKASQTALICDRRINSDEWEKERPKLMALLERSYRKAPFFASIINLVSACLNNKENMLVDFLERSLVVCRRSMNIDTQLIRASTLDISRNLKGEERIIAICKKLGATSYINAVGGKELYNRELFAAQGIDLSFIETHNLSYPQLKNEFVPWLSIIDVMMFNSAEKIREYLNRYELV